MEFPSGPRVPELPTRATIVLTVREKEILDLTCQEMTRGEIADHLGIQLTTVGYMMTRVLKKTSCHSAPELRQKRAEGKFDIKLSDDLRCYSNRKKRNG